MRYILMFWALPMGLFWSWYGLAANDINFGTLFFSREIFDRVFHLYGAITGIAPEALPPLIARACVVDTFLIFGILVFRRRRAILGWVGEMRARYSGEGASPSA